jgi:hypothetical protein
MFGFIVFGDRIANTCNFAEDNSEWVTFRIGEEVGVERVKVTLILSSDFCLDLQSSPFA